MTRHVVSSHHRKASRIIEARSDVQVHLRVGSERFAQRRLKLHKHFFPWVHHPIDLVPKKESGNRVQKTDRDQGVQNCEVLHRELRVDGPIQKKRRVCHLRGQREQEKISSRSAYGDIAKDQIKVHAGEDPRRQVERHHNHADLKGENVDNKIREKMRRTQMIAQEVISCLLEVPMCEECQRTKPVQDDNNDQKLGFVFYGLFKIKRPHSGAQQVSVEKTRPEKGRRVHLVSKINIHMGSRVVF